MAQHFDVTINIFEPDDDTVTAEPGETCGWLKVIVNRRKEVNIFLSATQMRHLADQLHDTASTMDLKAQFKSGLDSIPKEGR